MAVQSDLLVAAIDYAASLVEGGWTQGAYCRTEGGHACPTDGSEGTIRRCDLAWAVERAAEGYGLQAEQLRQLVTAQLPEPYTTDHHFGLERWNDVRWRTRSEVLLLLRRVRRAL